MLAKRIVPCLDVDKGRVVKGVRFVDIRDAGDPVELAARYDAEGADEIVFLDITASHEQRDLILDVAARTAESVFIPLTVGGGVREVADVRRLAAGRRRQGGDEHRGGSFPRLDQGGRRRVREPGDRPRDRCAPGARAAGGIPWNVYVEGGRTSAELDAIAWAEEGCELGAGEILLTSMDRDGTNIGYDLELTRAVATAVPVPVIASGGAGTPDHLADAVDPRVGGGRGGARRQRLPLPEFSVAEAKRALRDRGLPVRMPTP